MYEEDIFLVGDTQQSSYEEKTKKSQKRNREELRQSIASSGQTSYSSQDTEDSGTSRKKHKKKKSSSETSDAFWVIPETQLNDESEINNFVPKKKKKKMKHRGKRGSDDECWSPSTPQQSSQLSSKKALKNGDDCVVGDECWSPSTPQKSSRLSSKKALKNGGDRVVGDECWSPSTPQKSSRLSSKKALKNGDDCVVGDECWSPSTPQKSSRLSSKKALKNGGDRVVGDECWSPSTPQKSSRLSSKKALKNGDDRVVGDECWSPSTPQKSSQLSSKKALKNGDDCVVGNECWSPSTPKKSSQLSSKKALKNGGDRVVDDECWSPSTPQKSSQLSSKKALKNRGDRVVGDECWSPSTPPKSSKLPWKEDLENGSVVDGHQSSHKKKKRKRREAVYVPAKEKAEATRSQREDQVDLDQTIDTQMDLFASSPLSFSEGPQGDLLLPRDGQEGGPCPAAEDSDATQVDLEMEGTSGGDHEEKHPPSPSKLPTSEVNTKLGQSRTGRKRRATRKPPPSETSSEEEEDVYDLDKEQLENARKELEEFIPRAKTLSDSAIRQLAARDLSRFKELKKKGMAVKFGVFSQAENNILIENMEAFLEESGIESAEKLLFTDRFPEEQTEIKRLKCQYAFCERIAQGIARPWRLVYYRARKMFDPQNYNGRYTKEEEKKLFKYHAMYGNRWKKISELMNRSSHSIALKYAQMVQQDFNIGPWTKEETSRLLQTLRDLLKTKVRGLDSALENRDTKGALTLLRENLYKNIGWMKVAAQVKTRNWRQCKKKWMSILTKRMLGKSPLDRLSNLQFKIDLIERLYELNVADTNEIDWENIAGVIGNVPPDYVQSRYYQIKSLYVPFWYQKTFPEIIDYLFEETLPELKETLEKLAARQRSTQEEKSCKKAFLFEDIFYDILEYQELNSDDGSDEETGEPSQAND